MHLRRYGMVFVLVGLAMSAFAQEESKKFKPARQNGVPDLYIVVLADGVAKKMDRPQQQLPRVAEVARDLAGRYGGVVRHSWELALHGFLVRMPEARARKLAEDPRVTIVEQDSVISAPVRNCAQGSWKDMRTSLPVSTGTQQTIACANADPASDSNPTSDPQCLDNWGLDRSDASTSDGNYIYNGNNGSTVHVYLMDTGILWTHQEFLSDAGTASRVSGGVLVDVNPQTGAVTLTAGNPVNTNDQMGHGTHVAAIIAGRRFGVAKAAMLHPVRTQVGGYTETQQISATISGLDWIIGDVNSTTPAKRPAVINWSGGNEKAWVQHSGLQAAIAGVLAQGIILVQSAGNHEANLDSTGQMKEDAGDYSFGDKFPDVIVVGGIGPNFKRWTVDESSCPSSANTPPGRECGSITGSSIDLWAPAAWVNSASKSLADVDACPLPDVPCRMCKLSGTSMAAPHVTGAVAIYLKNHPNANAAEVTRALRANGRWNALTVGTSTPIDPKTIGTQSDNVVVRIDTTTMPSNTAPVASFTIDKAGRTYTFTGSGSSDDGGIVQYSWQFGDGTSAEGTTLSTTSHTYATSFGSNREDPKYAVLRVSDGTMTDHVRVPIPDDYPEIAWTYSCTGLTCTFDSSPSSDDFGIVSRKWTFPDGSTSTSTIATHTYPSWNEFSLSIELTDTAGQRAAEAISATGVMPPPANVIATGSSGAATVQWTPVPDVDGYVIERKVDGSPWATAANVMGGSQASFTDMPPSAPHGVVLYRVFSKLGAAISAPSNNDVAFVEPLETITTETPIRAVHLTQLRKAVNGLLIIGGGTAYFSANDLSVTLVQQQEIDDAHFMTVMQKLNDARTDGDVGLPAVSFRTPPPPLPAPGVAIEDTHIIDLRAGIQ